MRPLFPHPTPPFPPVKVCGLTRLADALACAEQGVQAIGINFWPQSKRYHPLALAGAWLPAVPASLTRVALFVNATLAEIQTTMDSGLLDMVQLHGDESPDFIRSVMDAGRPCLRALSVRTEADLEKISQCPCSSIILDAYAPGHYGGTGQLSDWALAATAVRLFPEKQILLSGGLTPQNATAAWQSVQPAALDLASGVEQAPGLKSPQLIADLMQALRGPVRSLSGCAGEISAL